MVDPVPPGSDDEHHCADHSWRNEQQKKFNRFHGSDFRSVAVPSTGPCCWPSHRCPAPGTVVVFQWLIHDVSRVTAGLRRTVKLGFWGPPLR